MIKDPNEPSVQLVRNLVSLHAHEALLLVELVAADAFSHLFAVWTPAPVDDAVISQSRHPVHRLCDHLYTHFISHSGETPPPVGRIIAEIWGDRGFAFNEEINERINNDRYQLWGDGDGDPGIL